MVIRALLAISVFAVCAQAHAQDRPQDIDEAAHERATTHALRFDEALDVATDSREIAGLAQSQSRLRVARDHTNALPDDLQVSVEAGAQLLPSTAFQGRIGVLQHFSTRGLGDAHRSVVDSESMARAQELAFVRLNQRLRAGAAWIRLWVAEHELALLREELVAAQRAMASAERGLDLGELLRADVLDATSYCEELRVMILDTEASRTHAQHDLERVLETEDVALTTAGDLPQRPMPDSEARQALVARVRRDPELVALVAGATAFRARAEQATAQNAMRIGLGAIVDRTTPSGIAVLAALAFTFPTTGRGARESAMLNAEADAALGRAETRARQRAVDFEEVLHELDHSALTRAQVAERWVPALALELAERERLFAAGESTMLEVFRARRASLTGRVRELAVHGDETLARQIFIELDGALGAPSQ
ncbi:MAG: TolC family protein [Sandaracinaceae bacterium]|nr:TolC family protein [Sandaracinaceae bacterium]